MFMFSRERVRQNNTLWPDDIQNKHGLLFFHSDASNVFYQLVKSKKKKFVPNMILFEWQAKWLHLGFATTLEILLLLFNFVREFIR